jgi:thiamine-phosphate pyrophosphorylase
MVTDRHRGYPGTVDALVGRVHAAARAGVALVQIRERGLTDAELLTLVGRCVEAVRGTASRVIVNDRTDVALAAGAHGVHLPADSVPAARVRRLAGPGFLIGRSVHSTRDAEHAEGEGAADYLIFGTTPSGLPALTAAVAATRLPVLAIGGITEARAGDVAGTGAAGVAAIGLFAGTSADALRGTVEHVTRAFDSARNRSLP